MQNAQKMFDWQKARFFDIHCAVCEDEMTTVSARVMVEHADGLYSFYCRQCSKTIEQQTDFMPEAARQVQNF